MIQRGEIYLVNLTKNVGSEQGGIRPAVIIQNDKGNQYSPTTVVCPITSKQKKNNIPTHVELLPEDGVSKPSTVLCEQPMTIDKSLLMKCLGRVENQQKIIDINQKIMISLGVV
mgnify:CR=1 FL=1